MTRRITMAAAAWLALTATGAQAAQAQACLTPAEGAGLMLAMAPDALKAVGGFCAAALPPTALLRQTGGPFYAKYQAAADGAWSDAKSAIAKMSGGGADAVLQSDLLRPMIGAVLMPLVTKGLKPGDCAAIDHVLTLLTPLPPRNAADLVVTIVQLDNAKKGAKGGKPDLPICPLATP